MLLAWNIFDVMRKGVTVRVESAWVYLAHSRSLENPPKVVADIRAGGRTFQSAIVQEKMLYLSVSAL